MGLAPKFTCLLLPPILFVGSTVQAFQIVKPSCSLLYSPEQNIIYDRDNKVSKKKVIDMDHDLLKHPEKLRIFADPNAYVATVENMIRETYSHPDFDITDMMMRFSAEGYRI